MGDRDHIFLSIIQTDRERKFSTFNKIACRPERQARLRFHIRNRTANLDYRYYFYNSRYQNIHS